MKRFLTPLAALILAAAPASAQMILGTYDFDNTDGTNNAPASKVIDSQPANANFSFFSINGGDPVTVTESILGKGANNANKLVTIGWPADDTFDADTFLGFTITADAGFDIELDEISFVLNKIATTRSPRTVRLQISNNGFDTVAFTDSFVNNDVFNTNQTVTFDIASASLGSASEWEFRFQFNNQQDPNPPEGPAGIRLDTVQLTGDISAIPEPGTYGMLLGGACFMLVLFRRRRHS